MRYLKCPHCRIYLLNAVIHENVEIDACTHCGGLWFEKNELDKVISAHDPDFSPDHAIVETIGVPALKKAITAKELINDIRKGIDDNAIIKKYDISFNQLHNCFNQMIKAGVLKQEELDGRSRKTPPEPRVTIFHALTTLDGRSRKTPPELPTKKHDERSQKISLKVPQKGNKRKYCPDCNIQLNAYWITEQSDLEIDVCEKCHGIWLDRGELDHAKALPGIASAMEEINRKTTWGNWFFQFFLTIPVEFNMKPRKFPIVTTALIILNTVMLILMIMIIVYFNKNAILKWAFTPGADKNFLWFLTLITSQFLHSGLMHLAGNMYFLYIIGDNLEDALGRMQYLAFYLICGILAALTHAIFESNSQIPTVGASGAIAGIMAGYVVIFRKARLTFMFVFWQYKLPAVAYFGIWIAFNILGAMTSGPGPGVAWFAHLGGFAAGLAGGFLVYDSVLKKNPLIRYINRTKI